MQTPTITRVSLEPFCLVCGGGLEIQGIQAVFANGSNEFLGWTRRCRGCNKLLWTSEVAWRKREKEEE